MSLRLFHVTEFAQSQLSTPASQRDASRPFALILLFSLWLASVSNLALWQALSRVPELSAGAAWRLGIILALMMACVLVMLLSLLSWRRTLKISIALLLLLAALNAYFMLTHGTFINADLIRRFVHEPGVEFRTLLSWRFFIVVLLLGIVPTILLWRTSVRRTPVFQNLMQNVSIFATASMVLAGLWLSSHQMVTALVNTQPQIRLQFNPFNVFQSLAPGLVPALKKRA